MTGCTRSDGPPAAGGHLRGAKPLVALLALLMFGNHPSPTGGPCCAGAKPAAPNETAALWLRKAVSMPCRENLWQTCWIVEKVCSSHPLDCRSQVDLAAYRHSPTMESKSCCTDRNCCLVVRAEELHAVQVKPLADLLDITLTSALRQPALQSCGSPAEFLAAYNTVLQSLVHQLR